MESNRGWAISALENMNPKEAALAEVKLWVVFGQLSPTIDIPR